MNKVQWEETCMVKDIILVLISMVPGKKDREILISGVQKVLAENTEYAKTRNSKISCILNITMQEYLSAWLDGIKDSAGIEHTEILVDLLD